MSDCGSHRIHCFEYKEKGSKRKHTKVYDWIHYHTIATSYTLFPEDDLRISTKGYSSHVKYLETIDDVARTAGYIQKHMLNECDVGRNHLIAEKRDTHEAMKNVFDEYAFSN